MRLGRAAREPDETSVDTSGSGPGLSTTGRHVAVPAAPLPRPHGAPLLGELLVTVGLLTRPQLDESLLQQAESGKRADEQREGPGVEPGCHERDHRSQRRQRSLELALLVRLHLACRDRLERSARESRERVDR